MQDHTNEGLLRRRQPERLGLARGRRLTRAAPVARTAFPARATRHSDSRVLILIAAQALRREGDDV
jgi:RNA:NAD 2'-phosphotransferase (TPT1/KptA family)